MANNTLPQFMMSHIQNKKNKIFLENSPERKTHDNMLTSSKKLRRDSSGKQVIIDEANVLERIESQKIMSVEMYNEIMIAKQEKMSKAYT